VCQWPRVYCEPDFLSLASDLAKTASCAGLRPVSSDRWGVRDRRKAVSFLGEGDAAFLDGGRSGWRLFHATLAEFLLDEDAADELWCPEPEQHARLVSWIVGSDAWAPTPSYPESSGRR
jgi:hypothetical protein